MSGRNPPSSGTESVTQLLHLWRSGDRESGSRLVEVLYDELHRMAAKALVSERRGHTLQPTALVNELYLRLTGTSSPDWHDRAHFFAVAANTIRRILVDHARAHRAERRGGTSPKVPIELIEIGVTCAYDDLLAIDEALTQLEQAEPRAARVTELRFFVGLQESEIADQLGISEITVKRDWKFARAWLAAYLDKPRSEGNG